MNEKDIRISFLITHFNRPKQLKHCINYIKKLNLPSYEIIVSDDYSNSDIIEKIKTYKIDNLILSNFNQGLANNINKGVKACKGQFLIYCQEDFYAKDCLKDVLEECCAILDREDADMIRFITNVSFNKLIKLSNNISLIPKFSFSNFSQNYYQYSDHPFIVKRLFFETNGYYLENTSGDYGETEYAIRMLKSKIKIAITNDPKFTDALDSVSVIDRRIVKEQKIKISKKVIKILRAFRMYFECVFYNNNKRGLISYKNGRQ